MMLILKPLKNRLFQWMIRRRPRAKTFQLNQRSTYIFPTRYGFMLLAMVLLMAIGATNYQNNLIFLATFLVISMGVIGIIMTFNNLVGIRFSAHNAEDVFAGQIARFPVSMSSDKSHISISLGLADQLSHTVNIEPQQEQRLLMAQECLKRGSQLLRPIRCQTIFPLGFLQAWSWLVLDSECIVYPHPIEPKELFLAARHTGDDEKQEHRAGVEDYYGLRAYRTGDNLSRIHWKSFAREKGLQTKEFVEYLSDPNVFDFDDFSGVDSELRLSYLCFLLVQAEQQNAIFALKLPSWSIEPNQGKEHLQRCLRALALYGSDRGY